MMVVVACSVASAGGRKPAAPPTATLEDSSALEGFKTALAAQRAGTADHPLRISYVGDSLTADDQITNTLRTKLAELVGDGGPGFSFAAPPHPYCQHRSVTRVLGGAWRIHGISGNAPPDHLLGLGGSAE